MSLHTFSAHKHLRVKIADGTSQWAVGVCHRAMIGGWWIRLRACIVVEIWEQSLLQKNPFVPPISLHLNMITQLMGLNSSSSSSSNNSIVNCRSFTQGATTLTRHCVQLHQAFDPICEWCVCLCTVCVYDTHHKKKIFFLLKGVQDFFEKSGVKPLPLRLIAKPPLPTTPAQFFQIGLFALSPAVALPPLWLVSLQLITWHNLGRGVTQVAYCLTSSHLLPSLCF